MTDPSRGPVSPAASARLDAESLCEQKTELRRYGGLNRIHWLIVGLSFLITLFAWHTSQTSLEAQVQDRFDHASERVVALVEERLQHYEDALLGGVATLQVQNGRITRDQWRVFASYLDLGERYPGVNGIGVIHPVERDDLDGYLDDMRRHYTAPDFAIHPEHEQELLLPIVFIEPERGNEAAIGLDVAFEINRRTAARKARDSGLSQITGPIELVQDNQKTPGFLFYAPFYLHDEIRPAATHGTDEYRRAMFRGLVYAPLIVRKLLAGTLNDADGQIRTTISDGDDVLHDEWADNPAGRDAAAYGAVHAVELYGRTWTFDVRSTPSFEQGGFSQPLLVLVSGIAIDTLLLLLFAFMARRSARLQAQAERMTDDLAAQAASLAETNRDLESFAHILSHDLKTPIRGIQNLSSFLKEDLEEYVSSPGANPDVAHNLARVNEQANRGNALIEGIFEYSVVGNTAEPHAIADTADMVEAIGRSLMLAPKQLTREGDFPVFDTNRVRLEQVLANLIGNAHKYSDDLENLRIRVSVERQGEFYRFTVSDNGPGIESRYHEHIFEPFKTLEKRASFHGSGLGLSIVKRAVESLGGTISVESEFGHGATFRFLWPIAADGDELKEVA